jgi:hypothetical protein
MGASVQIDKSNILANAKSSKKKKDGTVQRNKTEK